MLRSKGLEWEFEVSLTGCEDRWSENNMVMCNEFGIGGGFAMDSGLKRATTTRLGYAYSVLHANKGAFSSLASHSV